MILLEGSIATSASNEGEGSVVQFFLRLTGVKKRGYDTAMDRLFLIDHSLKDTGGHHFDYVRSVADAARQSGRSVTIGCHRKLARTKGPVATESLRSLQQLGDVRAVFRETVYQGDSCLAGLRRAARAKPLPGDQSDHPSAGWRQGGTRWLSSAKDLRVQRRRKRITRLFTAGCREFFRFQAPVSGDQVLVAASSELEVAGAVDFLAAHPAGLRAEWHFLFHFNLFDGWTPEYESQRAAMVRTRRTLMMAIRKLPAGSMRFHATTETLADQLNHLGVARFAPLPYPISSDFLPAEESIPTIAASRSVQQIESESNFEAEPKTEPVSLVCAGATRREKGQATCLQDLVDAISEPLLHAGKAKLLVQRPKQKRFGKRRLELTLADRAAGSRESNFAAINSNAIEYLAHPLPRAEYQRLLRSTDVGLFCYDARSYFSRCAGILVEMLACGKPVIVPAGTWLADQIQQPIDQHVSDFQRQHKSRCQFEHADFQFDRGNVPGPSGVWSFDKNLHPFAAEVDCEAGDQVAVARFDWHWPRQHGLYARVECVQLDCDENVIATTAQAIGVTRSSGSPRLLFRLQPECRRLKFHLTNAFGNGTITIRNFSMELYSAGSVATQTPVGAVGVIAASARDLPDCVAEVVTHIVHYRQSAEAFSHDWINRHHPQRTVDRIFNRRTNRRTLSARVA